MLRGEGFGARLGDIDTAPEGGVPYVSTGELRQGFSWPAVRLALLTEADLAARGASRPGSRDERRLPAARRRGGVDPLQLKAGDYVVHEQHGVGRFVELTSRTAAGATREYLVLEYAPARRGHPPDRLYVPTDQLDEVTKYVGRRGADAAPARRRGLGEDQGPCPQGGPRDRRGAHPAVLGADGLARLRVRARHALAARA